MSMATPPVAETLTLPIIFTEFNRIKESNYRLFLTLSFLFLIPSSSYLAFYPLTASATIYHRLLAAIIAGLLFACGVVTITYTTYHGLSNRSVTLGFVIKSLRHSFLPIVFTSLITLIFSAFSTFFFVFSLEFIKRGLSNSFLPLVFVTILTLLIIPLQVYYALTIAINESNWSFELLWLNTRKLFTSKLNPIWQKFMLFFALQSASIDICLWDEPAAYGVGWPFVLFGILLAYSYAYMMFLYISSATVLFLYLDSKDLISDVETSFVKSPAAV